MSVPTVPPLRWRWHPASLRSLLLLSLLLPLWAMVLATVLWQALADQRELGRAQDAQLRMALAALASGTVGVASAHAEPMGTAGEQTVARPPVRYRISTPEGEWVAGDRDWAAHPWRGRLLPGDAPDLYTSHWQGHLLRAAAAVRKLSGQQLQSLAAQAGQPGSAPEMPLVDVVVQVGMPLADRWPSARAVLSGASGALVAGAVLLSLAICASVAWARRWLQRSVATMAQPLADVPEDAGPAELHALSRQMRALYRSEHDWVDEQRRFLAEASHQLRTPMAVLRTQLQSAIDGTVAPAEVLPQMLHTVDRATGLANQLLSLTKLEQLKRSGGLQPTDIHAAARDAVMELSPLIAAKRLDFSLDGEALDVPADAVMLGELLRNLLANAIHHTPHGGALGMLLRDCAGTRELVVWDEGPGVDGGVFPRLFQPFSATKGGVGLGLSICRQIADAMGATIHIYNRIDQGKVIGVDAVVSWGQGP